MHKLRIHVHVQFNCFPKRFSIRYSRISHGVLIDRLISRGIYPLALEVCNYLNIPSASGQAKVLRQWAIRTVLYLYVPCNIIELI